MTGLSRKDRTLGELNTMEGRWWNKKDLWNMLSIPLAIFVPIVIPVLNMLILDTLWGPIKKPVNRPKCNCRCFDTIFRGLQTYILLKQLMYCKSIA